MTSRERKTGTKRDGETAVPASGLDQVELSEEAQSVLLSHLERSFRQVAFFNRVPLCDLALIHPEALACGSKEEFLYPHLESLRALIRLALKTSPAEVGRLARSYRDVGRLLSRGQSL